MSSSSKARRERRALKSAGVAVMDRVSIESGAMAAAVANGANLVDLIAFHVAGALERLDEQGADIVTGRTVVSIGAHPDFPGSVTIEAKAATLKRKPIVEKSDGEKRAPMYGSSDEDGM